MGFENLGLALLFHSGFSFIHESCVYTNDSCSIVK